MSCLSLSYCDVVIIYVLWCGTGMNLQICFMNETASDNESQASDIEKNHNNTKSLSRSSIFSKSNYNHPYQTRPLSVNITKNDKISTVQSGEYILPIVPFWGHSVC